MPEERKFTRQEFFDLVWSTPMQQLARDFKLSDVGLAKTCKRLNIPRPSRGHWQKAAVGKAPKRPLLPPSPNGVDEVRFYILDDVATQPEPVMSPEIAAWIEQEHDPANKITVPTSLKTYHPHVRKAKDALESGDHTDQYGLRWSARDTIPITVAKATIGRACRLLHTLLTAFAAHKWRVDIDHEHHHAIVHAMGESVRFSVDEHTKRVDHELTPDEERRKWRGEPIYPPKWDYHPTGELRLVIEYGYGHKVAFQDRAETPLEEQLNDVVLTIARAVIEVLRPDRIRRDEEERKRHEKEHERWVFQQQCDRFESAYRAWAAHQDRLRFVSFLEAELAKREHPSEKVRTYLAWTRRYVDWADPLPTFFEALGAEKPAAYHEFTGRRY